MDAYGMKIENTEKSRTWVKSCKKRRASGLNVLPKKNAQSHSNQTKFENSFVQKTQQTALSDPFLAVACPSYACLRFVLYGIWDSRLLEFIAITWCALHRIYSHHAYEMRPCVCSQLLSLRFPVASAAFVLQWRQRAHFIG